ncbi:hypothetical protein BGX29_000519 [Mortierella sp. GBA35]|nr:hypothetical protein BGX29_000519 [Mortierella sp. GBA35]
MVLVNTQGADPFEQLAHTPWFGYTLADWVFPNFIFMVGMAIAIVLSPTKLATFSTRQTFYDTGRRVGAMAIISSFWRQHQIRIRMSLKIVKRSVILFAIGLALNALEMIGRASETLWIRIPGVLPRIAFCYLVLALSVLWSPIGLPFIYIPLWFILTYSVQSTAANPIPNCLYPPEAISTNPADGSIVILPGYPPSRGQLSPSWCASQSVLDTMLFARDRDTNNPVFDSEGTLGTLMAIVTAWFGWTIGNEVVEQQRQQKMITKQLADEHEQGEQEMIQQRGRRRQALMDESPKDASDSSSFNEPSSSTYPIETMETMQPPSPNSTSSSSTTTELQQRMQAQQRSFLLAHLGEWSMVRTCVMFAGTILGWLLPICKGLWSPSFTFYSAGISINTLCILMYLYDLVKIVLEKISAHGGYDWVQTVWSYLFFSFYSFMPPAWASLIFSSLYILYFAPLLWYLNRRGIFFRV